VWAMHLHNNEITAYWCLHPALPISLSIPMSLPVSRACLSPKASKHAERPLTTLPPPPPPEPPLQV
jgi:hypothetical protein